jgi:hypothetical protein
MHPSCELLLRRWMATVYEANHFDAFAHSADRKTLHQVFDG